MRVVLWCIRVEDIVPGKLASQGFHARVLRARCLTKQSAGGSGATRAQRTRWLRHACLMQAARPIVRSTALADPGTYLCPPHVPVKKNIRTMHTGTGIRTTKKYCGENLC